MRFRKIRVVGLLILIACALGVIGSPTSAKADDTTDSATPTIVTGDLSSTTVNLEGPAGFTYPLYFLDGSPATRGLAGGGSWYVSQLALNLTTGDSYYAISPSEWVKSGTGVTVNPEATHPTDFNVNFVDATNTAIHPEESFNTQVDANTDAIAAIKEGLLNAKPAIDGYTLAATPVTANADQTPPSLTTTLLTRHRRILAVAIPAPAPPTAVAHPRPTRQLVSLTNQLSLPSRGLPFTRPRRLACTPVLTSSSLPARFGTLKRRGKNGRNLS